MGSVMKVAMSVGLSAGRVTTEYVELCPDGDILRTEINRMSGIGYEVKKVNDRLTANDVYALFNAEARLREMKPSLMMGLYYKEQIFIDEVIYGDCYFISIEKGKKKPLSPMQIGIVKEELAKVEEVSVVYSTDERGNEKECLVRTIMRRSLYRVR